MADVVMPVLGPEMEQGRIIRWMKSTGEAVREGEPILEVEGDKTTVEITAPESGIISILTEAGATVPIRRVIARIGSGVEQPGITPPTASPLPTAGEKAAGTAAVPEAPSNRAEVRASPRARRIAAERGIDLGSVAGTGPNGMIQEKDVLEAARKESPPGQAQPRVSPQARRLAEQMGVDLATVVPGGSGGRIMEEDVRRAVGVGGTPTPEAPANIAASPPDTGPPEPAPPAPATPEAGEEVALSPARRVTAERLTASWRSAPHATLQVEVDMRRARALREELNADWAPLGVRISVDALLVRAVASALAAHPDMNARWEEGAGVRRLKAISVGVAVDTDRGLFVPVLKDVGGVPLNVIARRLSALVDRVREGTLPPEDWSGGTFTITNLGLRGIDAFNPIVNPPQAGILAIGRIAKRPWVEGDRLVVAETATLSLAFDHRVIDGGPAADFLATTRDNLEHPLRLLAIRE